MFYSKRRGIAPLSLTCASRDVMITPVLREMAHGLCRLVYPPHCCICKSHLHDFSPTLILCPPCRSSITENRPPFCPKCSRFLGERPARPYCSDCRKHPPAFDFAWSACVYEDPLKALIHQFKYSQKTSLRFLFTELMTAFIRTYQLDIAQFDILLPIPLSAARRRERGYNQSGLLAQGISEAFHIPVLENGLTRRHTRHQTLLDEKERWTNIQEAFTIKSSRKIINRNILIIDDLLTTGATASEAARTLKKCGAQTVGVLTLAITL